MQIDQQGSSMPPCAVCGAEGVYREWRRVTSDGRLLKIESNAHPFLGTELNALACTACGNVQLFARPEEL